MWLELAQVDLDELIVFGTLVFTEILGIRSREITNGLTLGGLEVVVHTVVEWEERGSGTDLSTHVANGTHTSARERFDAGSVVLNDSTSASLNSENTSNLEDDI